MVPAPPTAARCRHLNRGSGGGRFPAAGGRRRHSRAGRHWPGGTPSGHSCGLSAEFPAVAHRPEGPGRDESDRRRHVVIAADADQERDPRGEIVLEDGNDRRADRIGDCRDTERHIGLPLAQLPQCARHPAAIGPRQRQAPHLGQLGHENGKARPCERARQRLQARLVAAQHCGARHQHHGRPHLARRQVEIAFAALPPCRIFAGPFGQLLP